MPMTGSESPYSQTIPCPACGGQIPFDRLNLGWSIDPVGNVSLTGTYIYVDKYMECPDCGAPLHLSTRFLWCYDVKDIRVRFDDDAEVDE